jgi:uncharacterized membrane protein YvbJ
LEEEQHTKKQLQRATERKLNEKKVLQLKHQQGFALEIAQLFLCLIHFLVFVVFTFKEMKKLKKKLLDASLTEERYKVTTFLKQRAKNTSL